MGEDDNQAHYFDKPAGVLIDTARERLIVCDDFNRSVVCLDLAQPSRAPVWEYAYDSVDRQGCGVLNPYCSALSPDGAKLYVVDRNACRVVTLRADTGEFEYAFGSQGRALGQLLCPLDIAVSADGSVWVAECNNDRVSVFDASARPWVLSATIDQVGGGGEFGCPCGLTMSRDGRLAYIAASSNIHVFDAVTREHVRTFAGDSSEPRDDSFGDPYAMCVLGDELYVCDQMNARVGVLDAATGEWRGALGHGRLGSNLQGVCANAATREIYVADSDSHRLLVFAAL